MSTRWYVCLSTMLSGRYWLLYPARQPRDSVTSRLMAFLEPDIALIQCSRSTEDAACCRRPHIECTPLSFQLSDRHAKRPSQIYRCGHDCPLQEAQGKWLACFLSFLLWPLLTCSFCRRSAPHHWPFACVGSIIRMAHAPLPACYGPVLISGPLLTPEKCPLSMSFLRGIFGASGQRQSSDPGRPVMAPPPSAQDSSVGLADGAVAFVPGRKAQDPAEWLFGSFHHCPVQDRIGYSRQPSSLS
ncbi:hypothetical protein V8C44DRAFT_366332 [Trichoderma aethiopicum]